MLQIYRRWRKIELQRKCPHLSLHPPHSAVASYFRVVLLIWSQILCYKWIMVRTELGSEQRHILFKGNPGWLWMDGRSWGWCGHWGLNFILHETRSCFLTFDGRNSQFGSKSAFWGGHNLSTCSWKRVVSCALWVCGVAQEHPAEGEGQKTH